eukprot:m.123380 g.123380  ORF g.123380 m.123380 type:complete len:494 (+) comp11127_c0_seq1:155-1636(+)
MADMDVVIKSIDGRRISLRVPPIVTVGVLKQQLESELGVEASRQRLVSAGGELSDTDQPLLRVDPAASGPTTLHLVPTRETLRRASRARSESSSSNQSAAGSSCVLIKRLDFKRIAVHESIGTGSFKSVFKGSYGSHRIACLQFRGGETATRDAIREAEIMTQLPSHPCVLRFFGMSRDPAGCHHLVCEFAELGSLDEAIYTIPGRRPPWQLCCTVGAQVASGMAAVAGAGLIHRDLSLRNVLCFRLDPTAMKATVKVGDFGRAIMAGSSLRADETIPLRWSAPEVLATRAFSEKSDVWSFGVTMWELVSAGAVPFSRHSDESIRQKILSVGVSGGALLPTPFECPDTLMAVVWDCWHANPRQRPRFNAIETALLQAADTIARRSSSRIPERPRIDPLHGRPAEVPTRSRSDPLVARMQQVQPSAPPADVLGPPPPYTPPEPAPVLLQRLMDMGFDGQLARRALSDANNDLELATRMLLSSAHIDSFDGTRKH